ncbi:uncharacterized protein LOC143174615 [Nomia melanderi]|uniref:uncharacterized protein LOC143174615 n=1 Tax=Nomia melanderi TaxID=2448451 RepID=UPI003FCD2A34
MSFTTIFLLAMTIAGISSKPVDYIDGSNGIEGSIHSIEKNEDQDVLIATTVTDATTQRTSDSSTARPSLLTWFLTPLAQNLQFSPQSFLRDRVVQLKETLNNLAGQGERGGGGGAQGRQLGNGNGLLQVVGVNDPGFFTDRLEPAGFFGGNGWLANKGGILGGPGAILSTGSILTDYPTPYRRK